MNRTRRTTAILALLLALATAAVFWPVRAHQFVNYDDHDYVVMNPHVQDGLTLDAVKWSFSASHSSNWHPITWLSHALDCQLYGLNPAGHHLTSLVLHVLNTVLLFLVLRSLTGAVWRSALVAALFGLHPLRVESVAWVAERKDLLSAFFFFLTVWAYAKSAESANDETRMTNDESSIEHPASSIRHRASSIQHPASSIAFLILALFCFALGLMSKPMLVTVPFVLLLLDVWPLRRISLGSVGSARGVDRAVSRLLIEKLPFLALSVLSCVVTFYAQKHGGAMADLRAMPFSARLPNALVSYAAYLKLMVWPSDLAVFYPFRDGIPLEILVLALLALGAITALALSVFRSRPYVAIGWFWYLGMLVPVIGIVQVGLQSMADRYTYLPMIGVLVAVVWSLGSWRPVPPSSSPTLSPTLSRPLSENGGSGQSGAAAEARWRGPILAASAVGVLALLAWRTTVQLGYWQDSITLFRRTLDVTSENSIARLNYASALGERGQLAEAEKEFRILLHHNPTYVEAAGDLAGVLAMQGKYDEAVEICQSVLAKSPGLAKVHYMLGNALNAQGKRAEAMAQFKATIDLNPDHPLALNDLAWMLATDPDPARHDPEQAVRLAERACQVLRAPNPQFVGTLAAAYAAAGRFPEAIATAEKAKQLAAATGRQDLAEKNEELLQLYRAGKGYVE
jgi:Flp pilus assembly protein TadD